MTIEWLRDLVIVVFGIAATLAVIVGIILALMSYARVSPVIDSVKKTTDRVEKITSTVEEEIIQPLAQIAAVINSIRHAIGMFGRFAGKKED